MSEQFKIKFVPSGRGKAQCEANPDFPDGIAVNLACSGAPSCTVEFPHPAPECGMWLVKCQRCALTLALTAAGRADDPRSLTVTCKAKVASN